MHKQGPLGRLLTIIARRGQYGHSRTPRNFYMGGGYCEYYWSGCCAHKDPQWDRPGDVTFEQWQKVAKLSQRYLRFVNYMEEIAPQWKTVSHTHWGDNSVDAHQVSKDGRTRTVQVDGPHGDVCF